MWFQFDPNSNHYQFVIDFGSLATHLQLSTLSLDSLSFCHFHVGVDGISIYFVLLTTFITPICILSNWTDIPVKLKYFLISFLLLETLQIAVFVVLDLFLFYIFFESVLIPLFFIVIIWGGSEKKYRAAFLLFLYTLAGSLFMLLAILFIYKNTATTDFLVLSLYDYSLEYQQILWLAFFISFAVKTPLFPFHIWLFRAHAEAPLAGSIILAAIILKLATYGFLRVSIPLFSDACLYFLPYIQTIATITIIYASVSTMRQIDSKQLVAMSSVAHINPNGPLNKSYLLSQTICGKPNGLNPFYLYSLRTCLRAGFLLVVNRAHTFVGRAGKRHIILVVIILIKKFH